MSFIEIVFTQDKRVFIVRYYYNIESYKRVIQVFTSAFPDTTAPKKSSIVCLVMKFEDHCTVMNLKNECRRSVSTTEKLQEMQTVFKERPNTFLQNAALQTGTSLKYTHQATKRLQIHPYQISVYQKLLPTDCAKRIEFCKWLLRWCHKSFDEFFVGDEV